MGTLVGVPISEAYKNILIRDPSDLKTYTGEGQATNLSIHYTGQIANGNGPTLWCNTTPPIHNDPGQSGSYAVGLGFSAFSSLYPTISAFSDSTSLPNSPLARMILGTLGAQTLKNTDPVKYSSFRTYLALTKVLSSVGDTVALKLQDNTDGLNGIDILHILAPVPGGTHSLKLSNTGGAGVCLESNNLFYPSGPSASINLGAPTAKWKELYCANGAINTSDGDLKTKPKNITDEVLDAWGDVSLITFQWLDAVKEKGDSARIHVGVIAQQIRDTFLQKGLDARDYGFLCHDEWDEITEPVYETLKKNVLVVNEQGEEVQTEITEQVETGETKVVLEAGSVWGIRSDQCLFMEAAFQRRRADRIEARLSALENK